ncbi:hypothetical protein C8E05_3811 [Rhodococcus wratislaviensis]|uniref:Uncharacterized protein n=1 Tax=Rhodococcus wratislaviensis TaxID=44752 RepID=A0AB38FKY6_RHOWR|nr:hypothetical protein [Rhodococcus wratislaviensis]REE74376.1 hypothetical protein C8E05_3811 [Rhodococcus wratislaviensis]SPZ42087.1 Uncharacterised protein [Rhodococcus wratislaviensis]
MRRRVKAAGQVPAELLDFGLWCKHRGHIGYEEVIFDQWCDDRAAWSDAHGWPGGDDQRLAEEVVAPVPDEDPFDWSKI